jgi:SAM-dependent methyltransferase
VRTSADRYRPGVPHDHHRAPSGQSWVDRSAHLEREGEITLPLVLEALDVVAAAIGAYDDIARVLDLGSGAGVAAVALAERFPLAAVTAIDGSWPLLDLVQARAADAGVADRVATRVADLEGPLDQLATPGSVDLVWASMVLHHVAALPQTLSAIHRLLRPGGVFAVVEFGSSNGGLPAGFDVGREGFAERYAEVVRVVVEGHLPPGASSIGWVTVLRVAGFELVDERELVMHLPAPLGEPARHLVLHGLQGLAGKTRALLSERDGAVLDALIDTRDPRCILYRDEMGLDISRTLLLARRR